MESIHRVIVKNGFERMNNEATWLNTGIILAVAY
jgi:hypothetical protein